MSALPPAIALPPGSEDSRLAMELAQEISDVDTILERHGMTRAELKAKLQTPHFAAMFKAARGAWKSDLNVKERVRTLAQHLVEDSLLPVYSILHNPDVSPNTRLDAFEQLTKVANVDKPPPPGASGAEGKVSITFNIGQDRANGPMTIEAQVLPQPDDEDG